MKISLKEIIVVIIIITIIIVIIIIIIICQAETHAAHTAADLLKTDSSAKVGDNKSCDGKTIKHCDIEDMIMVTIAS